MYTFTAHAKIYTFIHSYGEDMSKMEFSMLDHHATVQRKLRKAVQEGKLSQKQADEIYLDWLAKRREEKRRTSE